MTEPLAPLPLPQPPGAPTAASVDPAVGRMLRWVPFAMAGHLVVGLPALLISLVVAYGTFVQARATERMQQAATWPYLSYDSSNYDDQGRRRISLTFGNDGVGPALIGPVELRYGGRVIRTPVEWLEACCGHRRGQSLQLKSSPVTRVAIRPGERVTFFEIADVPANRRLLEWADRERHRLAVRACYCSIFRNCWIVNGAQSEPRATPSCPTVWTVYRAL